MIRSLFVFAAVFASLYLFILSLGLMGSGFAILAGTTVGEALRESTIVTQPVGGLVVGILATVLFQSSLATISVIVSMVASGILTLDSAVPLAMIPLWDGCNSCFQYLHFCRLIKLNSVNGCQT